MDAGLLDQAASDFASLLKPSLQEPSSNKPSETDAPRDPERAREEKAEKRDHRDEDSDSKDGQQQEKSEGKERRVEVASPGDAILQSMKSTGAEKAGAGQGSSLEQIVQQIADKILVSDPAKSGGAREVRITMKDSALPGTEVRIIQEAGRLQIQFRTDQGRSHELLAQHQAGLQDLLKEKLGTDVVVQVEMDSAAGDEMGGDGRSRQRRDLREEEEQRRE